MLIKITARVSSVDLFRDNFYPYLHHKTESPGLCCQPAAILTSMRIICQHQLSVLPRRLHILSEYSAKCQHFDAHRPHIFPFESKHMNNQCRTASCQAEFARRATDRTATSRPPLGKCLQRAVGPAGRAARTAAGLMVSKIWS